MKQRNRLARPFSGWAVQGIVAATFFGVLSSYSAATEATAEKLDQTITYHDEDPLNESPIILTAKPKAGAIQESRGNNGNYTVKVKTLFGSHYCLSYNILQRPNDLGSTMVIPTNCP